MSWQVDLHESFKCQSGLYIHTHSCWGTASGRLEMMYPSQMLLPVNSIKSHVPDVDVMGKDAVGKEIYHSSKHVSDGL